MTDYALGLVFDARMERVLLIRKSHPEWQRGKLNGIGGKVEDESSVDAMRREAREEVGLVFRDWQEFCRLSGPTYQVHCFYCITELIDHCAAMEDEPIEIIPCNKVGDCITIGNIPWLVALAINAEEDRMFTQVVYPK